MVEAALVDEYMNFATIDHDFAATWTTLAVKTFQTGLSIDLQIAWEIWMVEFYLPTIHELVGDNVQAKMALSSIEYATFPDLNKKGVIQAGGPSLLLATSGQSSPVNPERHAFQPPVLVAAPQLYFHAQGSAALTTMNGEKVQCRIGFTKVMIPRDKMIELLQTWERVGQ